MRVADDGSASASYQAVTLTVGKTYTLVFDLVSIDGATRAAYGVGTGAPNGVSGVVGGTGQIDTTTTGEKVLTFVATASTMYVTFSSFYTGSCDIDNVSVKLADEDRSVNNNGLIVNGTVTRSPVATGADLVSYSGFSTSNYLEQPYNPDLDFGTGDFCVMGWVKTTDNFGCIFTRGTNITLDTSFGRVRGLIGLSVAVETGTGFDNDVWHFVCLKRDSGVLGLHVNGVLVDTAAETSDLSGSSPVVRLGLRVDGASSLLGSLALWRISATAPTDEQIAKIYEDEKFLFQENAQATLYGTSDAVTALAHDPVTDLLHVGTSDGRSVFQGLRRVDNTTDAVSTAISASNDLIVEQ